MSSPNSAHGDDVPRRELGIALAVLLVLLVACYRDVIFAGRSLVYSNYLNPMQARVTPDAYGPDAMPTAEWAKRNLLRSPNLHDPGAASWQWEPAGEYLRHVLRSGEGPWWDPYVAAGAPAAGNLTGTLFFPPYLLVVLLGHRALICTIYALLTLLAAAFASYALLRRHGVDHLASLIGAAAVLFCGGLQQNAGSMIGQTLATLPVALLVTKWFFTLPTWRRAGFLALAYAALALSTFPPLVWASFGATALYSLAQVLAARDLLAARRWAGGVGLALVMAAFAYVPAVAALREAPQAQAVYARAAREVMPWPSLGGLISATVMGTRKVFVDPPMPGYSGAEVSYAGIVVLALASLAGAPRRRDGALFAAVLLGAIVLFAMKLVGLEPLQTLARGPLLAQIHFVHYFGAPLSLLVALLAGLGAERLLDGALSRLQAPIALVALGCVLLAIPAVAQVRGALAHPYAADWLARWYLVAALFAAVSVVVVIARGRDLSPRGKLVVATILVALVALEGIANTAYPRPRRWDTWRHPVACVRAALAAQKGGRMFVAGTLEGNAASAFGLYTLQSALGFTPGRTYQLYARYAGPQEAFFPTGATILPPEGVLDAAAIDHLLLGRAQPLVVAAAARGYHQLYSDEDAVLFARRAPPRYFFTSDFRAVTAREALVQLAARRPARALLLEEAPPWPATPNRFDDPPVEAMVGHVRAPRPGLVYFSESQATGWSATVDGHPARLLAANYAFRAVPVPPGIHEVRLRYQPPGLVVTLVLGLAGLLVSSLLVLGGSGAPPSSAWRLPDGPRIVARVTTTLLALVVVGIGLRLAGIGSPARVLAASPDGRSDSGMLYHVQWGVLQLPVTLSAGAEVRAIVTVTNTGASAWGAGGTPVRLGYRWWHIHRRLRRLLVDYASPVDPPVAIAPLRSARIPFSLRLPPRPGNFVLQLDLQAAGGDWFAERGAPRLLVPLRVGEPSAEALNRAARVATGSP